MNIVRPGPVMRRDYARRLTTRLRRALNAGDVQQVISLTGRLYKGSGDAQLSYPNWETYCRKELDDTLFPVQNRDAVLAVLTGIVDKGLSRRAAGHVINLHEKQVRALLPVSAEMQTQASRGTAPAGRNLLHIEERMRRFIAEVQAASPEYADAGRQYWTEHLFKIEALIADAWPLVTGATSAELDALLERIQQGE